MSDDETETYNHKQALEDWVAGTEQAIHYELGTKNRVRSTKSALYAFSERNLLLNLESVDIDSALRIWAIVEMSRREGFSKHLEM